MSLSNGNNFIFVHIYKCGGMTMRKVLQDSLRAIELSSSHATAKEIKEYCYNSGGKFFYDTAFKFSIVRNPFDWVVSLYEFIRGNSNHANYEEIKDMNFEQFCQWNIDCINNKKLNPNGTFNSLTSFLHDDEGKLLVDFVGRIENYEADIQEIFKRLNISTTTLESGIPKVNPSNREPDYRSYYNDVSRKIIEEGLAEDLKIFNYQF